MAEVLRNSLASEIVVAGVEGHVNAIGVPERGTCVIDFTVPSGPTIRLMHRLGDQAGLTRLRRANAAGLPIEILYEEWADNSVDGIIVSVR